MQVELVQTVAQDQGCTCLPLEASVPPVNLQQRETVNHSTVKHLHS